MASVNTITFDKAAYAPGETITATVDYTPDTPSVAAETFTVTANVMNSGGTVVATNTAPFVVNTPQPGDTVSVSDTGSHTWAEGATTVETDGSLSVPFTATA
jgi:hypothetical protein